MTPVRDTSRHPCFNRESTGCSGRVHLPVAPKCNIKCEYCNRKYDCVNESRPGVTSAVLGPAQALEYMDKVLAKEPRITVAGIAGPGDPMANPAETLHTLRLLKERHPHLLFCLSSNGLAVPPHVDELAALDVSHMTITINAVDPEVGKRVYAWVRDGKLILRGKDAAKLLIERQLESVRLLKAKGILVKVNTILVPGVNDQTILDVSRAVAQLGADIQNIMALVPNAGTIFEDLAPPTKERLTAIRDEARALLPQMTHCKRCRADAVGLLDQDRSAEFASTLARCARSVPGKAAERPYVAVASREGALVNMHLGEAHKFQIWGQADGGFFLVEERFAPEPGNGPKRWEDLAGMLRDCRAVLVAAHGDAPARILGERGVHVHACSGFIETALAEIYGTGDLSTLKSRRKGLGAACACSGGDGSGC